MTASTSGREIILETTSYGNAVRVSAVDVLTGTEVVFQTPSYISSAEILRLASTKLDYILQPKKP